MKILKEYLLSVCVVFTSLAMIKVLMEAIAGQHDAYYLMNFSMIFIVTCFATFVLFMHRIFHKVPLLIVMIGQYVVVISGVLLGVFATSKVMEVSSNAYRDLFLQITLPYILFAGIYYVSYFNDVKKANRNLNALKKK